MRERRIVPGPKMTPEYQKIIDSEPAVFTSPPPQDEGCCTAGNPNFQVPAHMLTPFVEPDHVPADAISIHLLRLANCNPKAMMQTLMDFNHQRKLEIIQRFNELLDIRPFVGEKPYPKATDLWDAESIKKVNHAAFAEESMKWEEDNFATDMSLLHFREMDEKGE